MGLLTILRKIRQKEKEIRLLILGLDNAGKTTILKKINGEDIDTISPTLGFNIQTLEFNEFKLNVWDVGGQKSLRSYWRNYFEENDGVIWVVDSADKRRLEDCRMELQGLLSEEKLAGASVLILANKQDLPGALNSQQISEVLGLGVPPTTDNGNNNNNDNNGNNNNSNDNNNNSSNTNNSDNAGTPKNIGANRHWHILACSAVTGEGLLDGFEWIVDDIVSRVFMLE